MKTKSGGTRPPVFFARNDVSLQRVAEPQAGAQEFLRIDRVAVDARLVVQMRAGRAAGRADPADDLADPDLWPTFTSISDRWP